MSQSEASREDRDLPASERRLQQAREQGQVPRSRDVGHAVAAGALFVLLAGAGAWLLPLAGAGMAQGLRFDRAAAFDAAGLTHRLADAMAGGLVWLLPLLLTLMLALVGAALTLGGLNFTLQPLAPQLGRLDPMAGLARLFARRHLAMQARLVVQVAVVMGVAGAWLAGHLAQVAALARMALPSALAGGFDWLQDAAVPLLVACVAMALADLPLQWLQHAAQLRMTREEMRQEHKESEGDPHVRGERRRRARELSRGRMMAAVPAADVVVTNPTHYAVALRYDAETMRAPVIVALGTDLLALRIREIAQAHGVPQLEAPPLARALHQHGELDTEVPVALYTAVAQVLAWVMRLRAAPFAPQAAPAIEVPAGFDPQEAKR